MSAAIVMVATGESGRAVRTEPREFGGFPCVIDHWRLNPTIGDAMDMVVTRAGTTYALAVVYVDRNLAQVAASLGLSVETAMDTYFLTKLPVPDDQAAREVARHLARQTVRGLLPMAPVTPLDVDRWSRVTAVVCHIVKAKAAESAPAAG